MDKLPDSTFERDLSPVARLLAAHDLPSPSEVFLQNLFSEVNRQDVAIMKDAQAHMLQRFEKTNEMLLNFNSLSAARYDATAKEFKHHTQLLADMKKDLDNVFRRIRQLKTQLSKQYPEEFKASGTASMTEVDEEEEPVSGPAAASGSINSASVTVPGSRPQPTEPGPRPQPTVRPKIIPLPAQPNRRSHRQSQRKDQIPRIVEPSATPDNT